MQPLEQRLEGGVDPLDMICAQVSLQQPTGPGGWRCLLRIAQCLFNDCLAQALLDHQPRILRLDLGAVLLRTRRQGVIPEVGPNAEAEVPRYGSPALSNLR